MRKSIILICIALLASAFNVVATNNSKAFKQNAKQELKSKQKRVKAPVELPTRLRINNGVQSVKSKTTATLGRQKISPMFAPTETSNIYGWLNYYEDPTYKWEQVGMNQIFSNGTYSTIFKCWDSPSTAFYHDNKIHTYLTLFDEYNINVVGIYYTVYDFETGTLLSGPDTLPLEDSCLGAFINMTFNHDDNCAYGYTYNYDSSTGISFAKIIMTNPTNVIKVKDDIDVSEICTAMTYHDGKIYGINFNGEFVTINTNGDQTVQFKPTFENNNTSTLNYGALIYSPLINGFLWANMWDADNSAHLYKIDATTESVTKLADYSNSEQFISFFTPTYEENPEAPAYIEIIDNTFDGTPNNYGSFTIKVPSTKINGTAIPEDQKVNVVLMIGSDETWNEDYAPGAEETIELRNLPEGLVPFSLIGSLGEYKTRKSYPKYIGYDTPKKPENVILNIEGVSWDAVTEGFHGGYFEPDNVTYTVYLNDECIARNITETHVEHSFEDSEFEAYIAEVYATCNNKESQPGYSNPMLAGEAVSLDYYCEPEPQDLALFTVINLNDDSMWGYRASDDATYKENCLEICAYDGYTESYGINDWLILPPLKFEDGNELYSFAADFANTLELANLNQYSEIFYTLYIGNAPSPDAMTTPISERRAIGHDDFRTYADKFQIQEAGTYYIGLHAEYKADILPLPSSLMIRNINVKEENVSLGGPAAVTDPVATAGEKGQLHATVEFNMPATSIDGTPLDANQEITAYVETEVAYDPINGKPGERVSIVVETIQGDNIIKIAPFIGKNKGYEIEIPLYTGVDLPGYVENVKETIADDNMSVHITWEAPTVGLNGGYVSPTGNTYYCAIPTADGWEIYEEIGTDVYEYDYKHLNTEMGIVQFGIIAENAAGQSDSFSISTAVLGTPYTLPMIETYPDNSPIYNPCFAHEIDERYTAIWRVTDLYYDEYSQIDYRREDGSGYALACSPRRIESSRKGRLSLPKFSTIDLKEPLLRFDTWISPNMPVVEIYAEAPGVEFQKIGTLEDQTGANYQGWDVVSIMLPEEFKEKGWVALYIELTFEKYEQMFLLDNYEFKDNLDNDFEVSSISGKRHPSIYDETRYEAKVTNRGNITSVAPTGKWQVIQNDKVIIEEIATPSSDKQYAEHDVVTYPYTLNATSDHIGQASVVFSITTPDENAKNDSASFDITIEKGDALTVTDLKAEYNKENESVELTWTEPSADKVVESFEDCTPFDAKASMLGEFKNIDGDGLETYGYNGWWRPNINPETGHGEAASFIVWNAEEANKVADKAEAVVSYNAYSGDNFAIAFVPFPTEAYVAPEPANDWLISPAITGGTEVSFAAKPLIYSYGPEVLRIMASSTTDDIEAFKLVETLEIGKYSNPNSDPVWEVFTVTLPEDAKYFALNYVSQDIFGLMLDDITYTPYVVNDITGYDIYRNNEILQSNISVIGSYADRDVVYGETYAYNILPLTTAQNGNMSNTAIVMVTNIDNISSESLIIGTKGAIVIKGFENQDVAIYTSDGKTIFNEFISKTTTVVTLDAGVYVVNAGRKTTKVVVK